MSEGPDEFTRKLLANPRCNLLAWSGKGFIVGGQSPKRRVDD